MIPFTKGVLRGIDSDAKTIRMELPPGLLDLSGSASSEEDVAEDGG